MPASPRRAASGIPAPSSAIGANGRPWPLPAAAIQERLTALIHPATYAQIATFQAMGRRARILTLPVLVAFVLSLIWRHLGSVSEAVRVLNAEGLRWTSPLRVSQQAMAERLRTFPAELFERILREGLPQLQARWQARQRPVPAVLAATRGHVPAVLAVDGSPLDALLRKVGLLRDGTGPVRAGRMAALVNVASRVPARIRYEADSQAHDQRFGERLLTGLERGVLVLFDLGFTNFTMFGQMTATGIFFLTRAKQNLVYQVDRVLTSRATVCDRLVWVGRDAVGGPTLVRLIEVQQAGRCYRYLTNVLDPTRLPATQVVALDGQRWRLEEAFAEVKRLLGLAYFWVGSVNGVKLQVWVTWLLDAVLVDLTDAVAERLEQPVQAVSLEMVYRGLSHFTEAYQRGEADDPVAYLASNAKLLGVRKRKRRSASGRIALPDRDVA